MFAENKMEKWAVRAGQGIDVPARLVLWNGRSFDLGRFERPLVVLQANSEACLPYLMSPSLDRLARAYIEGLIDLEGRLTDAIVVAYALAQRALTPAARLGRVIRNLPHTRAADQASISYHYDVSNAFYQAWLDPAMVYSCAYFENGGEDLATAQRKKIDHILRKIRLEPGQSLLDIGCGWGALVIQAARDYGARCVGITVSERQAELARARVAAAGLENHVQIRLQDYRDVEGTFDRITSVGMFEHVGKKNLPAYFAQMRRLLADDGLALNHGITSSDPDSGEAAFGGGEFIDKYVFPNGELPHLGLALRAMQHGGLEALDIENLRRHYARTLHMWSERFEAASEAIRSEVGERRFRIWRIYLAGCAFAFERDDISLYQILCHKAGRTPHDIAWSRHYMYGDRSGYAG
ncbi:MAG TPA: cyclopropane-fatty-acyl-phospholipid synthase family protein [Pseudoduganella sp.]